MRRDCVAIPATTQFFDLRYTNMPFHKSLTTVLFSVVVLASSALSTGYIDELVSESRSNVCVIPSSYASSNGTADDSPAIKAAFAKCAQNSVIVFNEGVD